MMIDWRITVYSYALIVAAALSVLLFWILWLRRSKPGALPLSLVMLAAAEWSIMVAFEASASTQVEKVFWSQLSYLGIVSVAPLFFLFSYEYTSNGKKTNKLTQVVIWVLPAATFLLAATNQWHYLVWSGFDFHAEENVLIYHHGIVFWIHIIYLYMLLMVSSGSLLWSAIRNRNLYRMHSITLLIAVPIPIIWNVLYLVGGSPLYGLDLTPIAFPLTGLVIGWGVYRIGLFDIVPIERDIVLENLTDGIIILDNRLRIVDFNRTAADLLQRPDMKVIGEELFEVCPTLREKLKSEKSLSNAVTEIEITDIPIQYIEVRFNSVKARDNQSDGYTVLMRDITNEKLSQIALIESEKRYKYLLENAALPVALLSPDHFMVLYANDRINNLVDEPGAAFAGNRIEKYFDRHGELQRILRMVRKNGLVNDIEAPLTTAIGRKIWVLLSANITQFENQEALFISFNDITARKMVEEAERQQRIFSEALRNSVAALNSTLKFDEVLDRILTSLEKVIPHDIANIMLVDEEGFARVVRAHGYEVAGLEKLLAKMNLQVAETPNLLKMAVSGQPLVIQDTHSEPAWVDLEGTEWVRSYIGAPILVKGKVVGYINLDSTRTNMFDRSHADRLQIFADQAALAIENARMFEKVEQMAIVDMLTGLYNRRHFYELAERELERFKRYKSPFSLILLDLDHFKRVNDNFGHPAGDMVLQGLAHIFGESLRKMDVPGRLGGEEFVILLPETAIDQALHVAERLRATIENHDFEVDGQHIRMTATMGVVSVSEQQMQLQQLVSMADKVMYQAKAAGRNRVLAMEDQVMIQPQ